MAGFLVVERQSSGGVMNEKGGQNGKQTLSGISMGSEMSSAERANFAVKPLLMTIMLILMLIPVLIFIAKYYGQLNRLWNLPDGRLLLIMLLSVPAMLLCILIIFFFRMYWRKRKTGSFLPSGEELKAIRLRRKKIDPLWQRVTLAVLFDVGFIFYVYDALTNNHHRVLNWIIAVTWSLMAFIFTRQVFRPIAPKCTLPIAPEDAQAPPEAS
jgi:hypothetical protein